MWITRVSLNNPYFAAMLMAALVVLGLFSLARLPVEEFPDIRFPIAVVSTQYPGASPTVVESEVTRPLEEALNTLAGIKHLRSYSFESSSVIVVEFELSVDPATAVQEVRDKVATVTGQFRREISNPTINQVNPSDSPMMTLIVSSDSLPPRELSTWADQVLRKRLQTVSGVGEAKVVGAIKREVRVEIDPIRLQSYGLDIATVNDAIARANRDFPAGRLTGQEPEIALRVDGKLKTVAQFAEIELVWRNGSAVYLRDVATIRDGEQEYQSLALINGQRALSLEIKAARSANIVATSAAVKAALAELKAQLPAGVMLRVMNDKADDVRDSLTTVRDTLLEGTALTVLIVFLFLGSWRSTVITGLTLPIALIGTLFAIAVAGFSINVMSLLALTLSIGLLIDDAIVVRENIVRHAGLGKSHFQAALEGTEEIGLAVLATTFTVVAVFLPVGFMGGIIGQFFQQFGLTVVVAVLISLLVSFSLDPMLSSIWYDPHRHGDAHHGPLGRLLDRFETSMDSLAERYALAIDWVLQHRKTTLAAATVLLLGSFALVPVIGAEFLPKSDTGKVTVKFKTAAGSSLEYTEQKARHVDQLLRQATEVKDIYINIGGGFAEGRNQASLQVILHDKAARARSVFTLMEVWRQQLPHIAGIELQSVAVSGGPGGNEKPIRVGIRGQDMATLERIAVDVRQRLRQINGVTDIESSLDAAEPALSLRLQRDAAASLGIDMEQLGQTLAVLLAGKVVSTWEAPDGENYDVRVIVPKPARQPLLLEDIQIAGRSLGDGSREMVPLSTVATVVETQVPRQINRMDQARELTLTANIQGRDAQHVFTEVATLLQNYRLPTGYQFDQGGESQDLQESFSYAVQALAIGVIFIYMILCAQFRSFFQPIAIMMSLPLAFIGVFLALLVWGSTLNMFSVIGVIMLMGLVAKNGILLIDFVNQARREGMDRLAALKAAGRVRLRPILMTSLAMIFGMLPLALSRASGAELNAPMAQAVIGGLLTSTLLTLFVVPVVYSYLDTASAWLRRKFSPPRQQT